MRYDKQSNTLTIPQKHLEAWINAKIQQGEFLSVLGMDPQMIKDGTVALENFRVTIDSDPAFAAKVEAEVKDGTGYILKVGNPTGDTFTISEKGLIEAVEQEEDEQEEA